MAGGRETTEQTRATSNDNLIAESSAAEYVKNSFKDKTVFCPNYLSLR